MKILRSPLSLAIGLLLFTSCNDNNEIIDQEPLTNNEYSNYNYIYKNQTYTQNEIEDSFPNLLSSSYVLFENKEKGYIYDTEEEANNHNENFLKNTQSREDYNNETWGFKVRFYEHENFKGRWWQYRKQRISVHTFEVKGNIPSWLNDKASSIVLDEIDHSKHRSGVNAVGLTCYQDYNQKGRKVYSSAYHWFLGHQNKKTWKDLRKGNWNDKISSWSVSGGGGR